MVNLTSSMLLIGLFAIQLGFLQAMELEEEFKPRIMAATAPLDLGGTVSHLLEVVNGLVGVVGGAASGLVFDLTGVALHDCAGNFQGKDPALMSCDEFLETLSGCESLGHIKPLLASSKTKYQKIKGKSSSASNPCSDN